jgi:hypothetical protein
MWELQDMIVMWLLRYVVELAVVATLREMSNISKQPSEIPSEKGFRVIEDGQRYGTITQLPLCQK